MSEEEKRRLEKAIAASVEGQLNRLFWKGFRWGGLPMAGMVIALVVFYARLSYHVSDNHERILIGIASDVSHLKADLESVKKSLSPK